MNSEAAMDATQNQSTVPSPNLATIMEQLRAKILQSLAPAITELQDNQNMLQAAVQQQDQAPRRPSIKPTKPDTFNPNNIDLNLWLFELETYIYVFCWTMRGGQGSICGDLATRYCNKLVEESLGRLQASIMESMEYFQGRIEEAISAN